jgi:glycosyltransferase involved in cell wall biosynthesis
MKRNTLISVIIPTLNSEKHIKNAVESIIHQTYKHYEIIIVDGASTDNTIRIIKNLCRKHDNIKLISENDNGIYDAMNKGIKIAKGTWVLFLGSDDTIYQEDVFERIFAHKTIEKYMVVYGSIWLVRPKTIWGGKFNNYRFIFENLPHQAVFYKKEMFEIYGNYNTKYKIKADKEFNMRWFTDKKYRAKYINIIVATFSGTGVSSTSTDVDFENDKFYLNKKYISPLLRFIANNRKNPIFKIFHNYFMKQQ